MTEQEKSALDLCENMSLDGIQRLFEMYRSRIEELEAAVKDRNIQIKKLEELSDKLVKEVNGLVEENKKLAEELTNCQDLLKRLEEPTTADDEDTSTYYRKGPP